AQHVHAGLASVSGFPTMNAAQEHNDLAGNADAFNAFLPRRVASRETGTKAMSGRTANAVRRPTSRRKQSAALHSADTKHARGRRSGKLAMFFSYARHVSARLRLDESAMPAGFLSNWGVRDSKATQRSPRRGRDFGRVRQDCPVRSSQRFGVRLPTGRARTAVAARPAGTTTGPSDRRRGRSSTATRVDVTVACA